jgi:peptidoglycan hydrolase-like protein with peptidoglycan-binding domain
VRAEVSEVTNGAQRPWSNASLAREVYLGGAAPAQPPAAAGQPTAAAGTAETPAAAAAPAGGDVDWTVEQKVWDEASKRNTVAHYELYLQQFPHGRFAEVARLNIDQLKEAEASAGSATAKPEQVALAPGSQSRTAVSVPDDVKQVPGTAVTEAALHLDRDGYIDLQLRLNALGYYTGDFDGSLGPRSRAAVSAWQKQNGIVETGYLTQEQRMIMVVQSDPMMAEVRARYDAQKAAAARQPTSTPKQATTTAKQTTKTASKPTTRKQQVATKTTTKRKVQAADDGIPYRPRHSAEPAPADNSAGSFAAGALLGTGLGLVIGDHH